MVIFCVYDIKILEVLAIKDALSIVPLDSSSFVIVKSDGIKMVNYRMTNLSDEVTFFVDEVQRFPLRERSLFIHTARRHKWCLTHCLAQVAKESLRFTENVIFRRKSDI